MSFARCTPLVIVVVAAVMTSACLTEDPESMRCVPLEPDIVDPAGAHLQYVVTSIQLPTTATEAFQFGIDLDDDEMGRPDNALGQILSVLTSQSIGYDLNEESQVLIDAGEILHLLDIQAVSAEDASGVGVTLAHADDTDGDPTDNFSGEEMFAIDATRGSGRMTGSIEDGRVLVDLGTVPLAVTFPGLGEPFIIRLSRARLDATFTVDGLEGRIAGAMRESEIDDKLLPVFQEGLMRIVDRDCDDGACVTDSFGETLLDLFDLDDDAMITVAELRSSSLVTSLFSPDVDLFDEDDNLAPRCDGVKDSLSIGVGFTAVPAVFPVQ